MPTGSTQTAHPAQGRWHETEVRRSENRQFASLTWGFP
ncbi:hypothetical protein BN940_02431 [Castellaniella defragrans 65Phen]|uniref:Uncharacterized protein n=1 Tax=Castellaniella defragrans (strain DSM 12143 / CCUG 39792 / 65Phen) TaxID=1437824 RepID=W8X100_CASD6|nr:hypothetical protein BN940_02431 [Castellaniella defragrans 65Phen]